MRKTCRGQTCNAIIRWRNINEQAAVALCFLIFFALSNVSVNGGNFYIFPVVAAVNHERNGLSRTNDHEQGSNLRVSFRKPTLVCKSSFEAIRNQQIFSTISLMMPGNFGRQKQKSNARHVLKHQKFADNSPSRFIHIPLCQLFTPTKAFGMKSLWIFGLNLSAPFLVIATQRSGETFDLFIRAVSSYISTTAESLSQTVRDLRSNALSHGFVILDGEDKSNNRNFGGEDVKNDNENHAIVLGRNAQSLLFLLCSFDAMQSIIENRIRWKDSQERLIVKASGWVGVGFKSPRTMFVIGALLRGFQLTTNLQYAFAPSIGSCALTNMGAIWVNARWLPRAVVGWTITPQIWRLCGGKAPPRFPNDV